MRILLCVAIALTTFSSISAQNTDKSELNNTEKNAQNADKSAQESDKSKNNKVDKSAQNKKEETVRIYGDVYDSFTMAAIDDGKVTVMTSDSTVVDTTSTFSYYNNTYSYFTAKLPKREATYIVKIVSEGYDVSYTNYNLMPYSRKSDYELPRILMKRSKKQDDDLFKDVALDGVVVKGTRVQVVYRGDTIVYNASAFNVPEGSTLDALVRKLPGAELKDNGDIYINGRKIDYLTINGDDFFKGKNQVALENLPYFSVKDIKVYDKSSEKSRMMKREVEQKDFVMDVSLKREYNRTFIANAEGGIGTEDRWMTRLFALYFDDHTRTATFFNANNVNESRRPGSDGEWSPDKMPEGLQATKQAGVNVQLSNKDKTARNTFDGTVSWNDSENTIKSMSETFASGGNIFSGSMSTSRSKYFSATINDDFQADKLGMWGDFSLNYSQSDGHSLSADSTYQAAIINSTFSRSQNESRSLSASGSLQWSKEFEWGDYLTVDLGGSYSHTNPSENFNYRNTKFAGGVDDKRNIFTDNGNSKNYSYNANVGYMFSLPNSWGIFLNHRFTKSYEHANPMQHRLDMLDDERFDEMGMLPSTHDSLQMVMDASNSYDMIMHAQRHQSSATLYRSADNRYFSLHLPVIFSKEKMSYDRSSRDTVARRSFSSFEPSVYYYYRKKEGEIYNLQFNMSYNAPSFLSLMPYTDTSTPLATRLSNPDQKSSTRYSIGGYSSFKRDSVDMQWWMGVNASLVRNAFATRTTYNTTTGAYTYINDNVNGNWTASVNAGTRGSFDKKRRLKYDVDAEAQYQHSVDYDVAYDAASNALSKVSNIYLTLNTQLKYQIDDFTAGIGGELSTRHSTSNRDNFERLNVYDFKYGATLQYTIPVLKLNLSTDINMFSRRGYNSSEINTDDLIMNAQLARTFCNGALTAKVTAFDLLKQLSTTQYSVNAQGRSETWYKSVPRYVMFSLGYKFTKMPKVKK